MKKLFFILTIFLSLLTKVNLLQAKDCDGVAFNPTIEYYTSYGKLVYDFKKTQMQITKTAKEYGVLEQGLFASGLAIADVKWEMSLNSSGKSFKGKNCVVPDTIKFFVGLDNPRIFVDRTLRPGSCEYEVVLRHEQTHQQINKATLDYFLPLFKEAVANIIRSIPPERISRLNEAEVRRATEVLTQKYTAKITPLVKAFERELDAEQGKLDNSENYGLESSLCR